MAVPSNENFPVLWKGARYGMTVNEVQAVVNNSYKPNSPDPSLIEGLNETLESKDSFYGQSATIRFYFMDGKLVVVNVEARGKQLNQSFLKNLIENFNKEYGPPEDCDDTFPGCVWPRTNLTVTMISVINKSLHVNFYPSSVYRINFGHH